MHYYFSSPSSMKKSLFKMGAKNFLLSFAVDAKQVPQFVGEGNRIIIDSGAFSLWNKGAGEIDIDVYLQFINSLDFECTCVNLDVIPQTGSSEKEVILCAEKSFENYLYLKSKTDKKILPVYHYGEDIKILDNYLQHTDYIGISPANDTHENIKREFLAKVFKRIGTDVKTHALGYSSFEGLTLFPFYSIDSISYKRIIVRVDGVNYTFFTNSKLVHLGKSRIKEFMELETFITDLWKSRGVIWD